MASFGSGKWLTTTAKDRVKKAHPDAVAQRASKEPSAWVIVCGGGRRQLGRGSNASTAWDDAATKLTRF